MKRFSPVGARVFWQLQKMTCLDLHQTIAVSGIMSGDGMVFEERRMHPADSFGRREHLYTWTDLRRNEVTIFVDCVLETLVVGRTGDHPLQTDALFQVRKHQYASLGADSLVRNRPALLYYHPDF
jgi:hypothetical protein